MVRKLLINDLFILALIIINAVVLFLDSFDVIRVSYPWLIKIDLVISFFFILEMILKIRLLSWKEYIADKWNVFDMVLNISILPSFVLFFTTEHNILFLTIVRLVRIIRFFRFLKFVPNIDHLMLGISRALKASVFLMCAFMMYLFIISIISCSLFKGMDPVNFGNPIASLYSTFKTFTIEGWYEIPDKLADGQVTWIAFLIKLYFIVVVVSGGICGLSLVNAVFVDEMVSDNNMACIANQKL